MPLIEDQNEQLTRLRSLLCLPDPPTSRPIERLEYVKYVEAVDAIDALDADQFEELCAPLNEAELPLWSRTALAMRRGTQS